MRQKIENSFGLIIGNTSITERIILFSLFLMPIFSMSVRHWLSGWFTFIALISLVSIFHLKNNQLHNEEKTLLWTFAFFLACFILSATLNGWTENSYKRIGTELKYLLFIPIYYLIRKQKYAQELFTAGIVLAGIIIGLQAFYDTFLSDKGRGWGIYGPIVFGDLSILFFGLTSLKLFYRWPTKKTVLLLFVSSLFLSLFSTYLSGNRNAWLTAIVYILVIPFLLPVRLKVRHLLATYLAVVFTVTVFFGYHQSPITNRARLAIDEVSHFFKIQGTPEFYNYNLFSDSSGFRLEQWRVALIVFRDAPFFGHGAGNAARVENEYVKKGIGHPDLYNPKAYENIGGLHSTYFETLVNEGLVGILALALFFGYPLLVFIKSRRHAPFPGALGVLLILSYMTFGLTENPLVHDNFSSFYLISLAVIFSTTVQSLHEKPTVTA